MTLLIIGAAVVVVTRWAVKFRRQVEAENALFAAHDRVIDADRDYERIRQVRQDDRTRAFEWFAHLDSGNGLSQSMASSRDFYLSEDDTLSRMVREARRELSVAIADMDRRRSEVLQLIAA